VAGNVARPAWEKSRHGKAGFTGNKGSGTIIKKWR
jgi:hypothetical protein